MTRSRFAEPRVLVRVVLLCLAATWAVVFGLRQLRSLWRAEVAGARCTAALAAARRDFPAGTPLRTLRARLGTASVVEQPHAGPGGYSPNYDQLLLHLERSPSPVWYCSYRETQLRFIFSSGQSSEPRDPVRPEARLESVQLSERLQDCL